MPQAAARVDAELAKGAHASVVALVDALLAFAHAEGASDLHIDPQAKRLVVRLRIDGILSDVREVPHVLHTEVLARIKILSGLRTDEHHAAQDGRFKFVTSPTSEMDVRVSVAPTYYGENAVLRLLSPRVEAGELAALGFLSTHEATIRRALARLHGMILVTGPTGSGKTSTLYTLVTVLNKREVNILTIEDPIEYSIEGVNQIQANTRTGLTFGNGLRSLLRQDPDVIMVGEIRDTETAEIATNIALTGHLLLSTLHTNDAPTALPRLLDMGIEPYLLASTVSLVIAQRLVRKICPNCKQEHILTATEQGSLSELFGDRLPPCVVSFAGVGCEACRGTGYRGRTGIFEVLPMTSDVCDAVLRKASLGELSALAAASGMKPMLEDGLEKILRGVTSVSEVLRMQYE